MPDEKYTVLVVDDDRDITRAISIQLKKEGYDVIERTTARMLSTWR